MAHGGDSHHLTRLPREGLVTEAAVNAGRLYGRAIHPAPRDARGVSLRTLDVTEDKDGLHYHAVAHNGLMVEMTNRDAIHHADGTSVEDNYYMIRVSRPGDASWRARAVYTDILMRDVRIDHLAILGDACEALGAEDPEDSDSVAKCLKGFDGLSPEGYLMTAPASLGPVAQERRLSPVPDRFVSVDDADNSSVIVWLMDTTGEHVIEVGESTSVLSAYADALACYMGLRRLPAFIEDNSVLMDTSHHRP